jgi:hypothetical protein
MAKIYLSLLFLFYSLFAHAQNDFFVLKKGLLTIQSFQKDSHITFQLESGQWFSGYIIKVQNDSFYFMQELVRYTTMGVDTLHIGGMRLPLSDVYALPRKGNMVVYRGDRVNIIPGKQSALYVKNGFLFQLGGGGYVLLNLLNNLFSGDPPFTRNNSIRLAIGAAVFLVGELLHLRYKPIIRMGRKYHLESVHL